MKRSRKFARRERGKDNQGGRRDRDAEVGSLLDVARCPLCNGPMTARVDRRGPYFHCFCEARREPQQAVAVKAVENRVLVGNAPTPTPSPSPTLRFPTCNNNLSSVG